MIACRDCKWVRSCDEGPACEHPACYDPKGHGPYLDSYTGEMRYLARKIHTYLSLNKNGNCKYFESGNPRGKK